MESAAWQDMVDGAEDDLPCFSRDVCLEDLLRDAPVGCLYCRLSELDEGDGE